MRKGFSAGGRARGLHIFSLKQTRHCIRLTVVRIPEPFMLQNPPRRRLTPGFAWGMTSIMQQRPVSRHEAYHLAPSLQPHFFKYAEIGPPPIPSRWKRAHCTVCSTSTVDGTPGVPLVVPPFDPRSRPRVPSL